jgi:hypothetical protein
VEQCRHFFRHLSLIRHSSFCAHSAAHSFFFAIGVVAFLAFRKQPFCGHSDFVVSGDGAAYRGNETDLYEVANAALRRDADNPVCTSKPRRQDCLRHLHLSFGAVSGDQGLVL